jgi:uncharacterized protein YpiB (UPF0302 family)
LSAYKIQLHQHVKPSDYCLRKEFATEMLSYIDENNSQLDTVCFTDEANFHLCNKVNKANCCIWGY